MSQKLDGRLSCAAALVRGGRLADVGTDHAYLPVSLLLDGRIEYAVASDINSGPLARARETVQRNGLADKVDLVLTDGLHGIDAYCPDDIAILGMGGELIASILDAAEWVKHEKYRFILQPMTKRAELREYLITHGFFIENELVAEAEGRIYQTVCASYVGKNTSYSLPELLLGRHNIERGDGLTARYAAQLEATYTAIVRNKSRAGADARAELAALDALRQLNLTER
ncbi:MAG: SAM-dependent methyltransferase [Clostridia bacterium]|nr:SAM-dependent methyltransferase [Clostridia bacterium]